MSSLYSVRWYRMARARLRLQPQVRVQRQSWRGERWYVLSDAVTGRQHRINEPAYQFIGRCDGQRTVQEVWNALLEQQPDSAPTQDEVLALLGQLGALELLQSERGSEAQALMQRREQRRRQRRSELLNPLSFRLPLGDPSPWLDRLDGLARRLFTPTAAWAWLIGVLLTLLVAATEAPALREHAARHLLSSASLVMVWLVYPVMKALHELGHGLALRRWGAKVPQWGLGLIFFIPAPYVDATAAAGFTSRTQRAMVGAAGVAVELALAALGFWLWLFTQNGWLHDLALSVMFIGVASTLLFNGNPLLRFDAYHVLCDVFELPNLASRSAAWWRQHLARLVLGSRAALPPHAPSEVKWLWLYAPASLAYRVALALAVVLWLGGQWMLLGLLALAYLAVVLVLRPLVHWARHALDGAQPGREHARMRLRLGLAATAAAGALCWLPLPLVTVAPAVVYLPEQAQLRPEVDGFVAELPLADGAAVKVGDLLLRLDNPQLQSQRDQIAAQLDGLRVGQIQQLLLDPQAAQNLALDIDRTQAELRRADERLAQLEVRAQVAGVLSLPRQGDLLGTYSQAGKTLGHVLAPGQVRVRAAVPQADANLVLNQLRGAEVRLADALSTVVPARVDPAVPAATRQLPAAALAAATGGPYDTDPADEDGLLSQTPLVLVDVMPEGLALQRVGGRAWVRFDHGWEPLLAQAWRRGSQAFLRHFAPSS